jgi:hypothetical protein
VDEGSSSGEQEEEEYVAMMGGFVRRMATIESLGSREAVSTLSGTMGSVALGLFYYACIGAELIEFMYNRTN